MIRSLLSAGRHPGILQAAAALGWAVAGFMLYHFTTSSARFEGRFRDSVSMVVCRRGIAVLVFGFIPLLAVHFLFPGPLSRFGLSGEGGEILPLAAAFGGGGVLIGAASALRSAGRGMYPQIRAAEWSAGVTVLSALTWAAYLAAYEFLYRGVLLFSWADAFGYWPALLTGVAIYVLIHVPKGAEEAVGSVIFGTVISAVTLETETILIAVVTHIAMALTNEWVSVARNPEMKFTWKRGGCGSS